MRNFTLSSQLLDLLEDESGAITVDWVVLTGVIMATGLTVTASIRGGVASLGFGIEQSLSNASVPALGTLGASPQTPWTYEMFRSQGILDHYMQNGFPDQFFYDVAGPDDFDGMRARAADYLATVTADTDQFLATGALPASTSWEARLDRTYMFNAYLEMNGHPPVEGFQEAAVYATQNMPRSW